MRLTQSEAAKFVLSFADNPVVFEPMHHDILETLEPGSAEVGEEDFIFIVPQFSPLALVYLTECKERADHVDARGSWDDFPTSWDYHEYVFDNDDGEVPYLHAALLPSDAVSYAYKNIRDIDVSVS